MVGSFFLSTGKYNFVAFEALISYLRDHCQFMFCEIVCDANV